MAADLVDQLWQWSGAAYGVKHATKRSLNAKLGVLPSDYDVALVSPKIMHRAEELGLNILNGPLKPMQIEALGLSEAQRLLRESSKYMLPVNFKVNRSIHEVLNAQPTIPFNSWVK